MPMFTKNIRELSSLTSLSLQMVRLSLLYLANYIKLMRMSSFEFINCQLFLLYYICIISIMYYKNFREKFFLVYLVNYIKLLQTAAF